MAQDIDGGGTPKKNRKGALPRTLGITAVAIPLAYIFRPTVLFLGVALSPTLVAIVIDKNPRKHGGVTVGGLNFAGAAPYILDLWTVDNTVSHALSMLTDVFALLVIFGAAAIGWGLYVGAPRVLASGMSLTSDRRETALKNRQQELIDLWGPEVAEGDGDSESGKPDQTRDS